jgi:hypothetical protein
LKSKLYQEAKGFEDEMMRDLKWEMGFPATNIARLSWCVVLEDEKKREDEVYIVTTLKPVPAADIKANRKVNPNLYNFTYREVKAGKHTIYVESYSFKPKGILQDGRAFCVVDKNVILYSRRHQTLVKILERDKKGKISEGLEAGLKAVGNDGMLALVLDVTKFPSDVKQDMLRGLSGKLPGLADAVDNMRTFTLKGTADDKVKWTASMTCKDEASAGDCRKLADAGIVLIKGQLKREMEREFTTPEEKEAMKAISNTFDAVKLSTKGAQVNGEVTMDVATAVTILDGMFRPRKVEIKKKIEIDKDK